MFKTFRLGKFYVKIFTFLFNFDAVKKSDVISSIRYSINVPL